MPRKTRGNSDSARGTAPQVSEQKTLEIWAGLWSEWSGAVSELGDDDGAYAEQDDSWHPPYFDGSSLASDIEKVAAKMLPMIEEVFELEGDESEFFGALEEIDEGIRSYPEWMGATDGDGCTLEAVTTRCVLTWTWLTCLRDARPGREFARGVLDMTCRLQEVFLNSEDVLKFLDELPDEARRDAFTALPSAASAGP